MIAQIVTNDDYITSDKFIKLAQSLNLPYFKRDFLFKPGVWRGSRQWPIWCNSPSRNRSLFLGHSDFETDAFDIAALKFFGARNIFGTNLDSNIKGVTTVPLGLTNWTNESRAHEIYGNTLCINEALQLDRKSITWTGSIYANFSVQTNIAVRQPVLNLLKNQKNVFIDHFDFSFEGRISYLKNLRKFNLVACPEGNGVDTHRLWETLYMGGTPIIIKSKFISPLIAQLPVIQIEDWAELNDVSSLEERWINLMSKSWDWNLITMTFWEKLVESKLGSVK